MKNQKQALLENLAATAELMGQSISQAAIVMMVEDLHSYPVALVIEALGLLRRESKGRFSLAAIIEKIEQLQPNSRPGADEAWAMIPRDEFTSVVMSQEMADALRIAQPLLDEGDQVAARMAFKETYLRVVAENKRTGIQPVWFASLGWNREGREQVVREAVRLGRLPEKQLLAMGFTPEKENERIGNADSQIKQLVSKLRS